MVDAVVAAFGTSYGEVSPDGEAHYPAVAKKDAQLVAEGPTLTLSELSRISSRTLVMAGDDDMPSVDHTIALYQGIARSELAVVPSTSHFLLQGKAGAVRLVGPRREQRGQIRRYPPPR